MELIIFVSLFLHLLPHEKLNAWGESGWALVVIFCIFWGALLLINYSLSIQLSSKEAKWEFERNQLKRRARYMDVFTMLNKGFGDIHRATDEQSYKEAFKEFCTILSKAYTRITNMDCHVCIKLCIQDKRDDQLCIRFETLFRSTSEEVDRRGVDGKKHIKHWLDWNTDFEQVFSDYSAYFSNNLCSELNTYKNSSFIAKGSTGYRYYDQNATLEHKENTWPLDYRACIVCPIIPLVGTKKEIYALICVDAPLKNAFIEKIDKEILQGCAEGIYNEFKQYYDQYIFTK